MDLIFSYGGGWQSIAIILLVDQGKLRKPDKVIFADTGYEKETTMKYFNENVKSIFERNNLKLEIASHDLATVDLYAKNGQFLVPAFTSGGLLRKFCSKEWKTRVINRYLRQQGYGAKNPIINWIGFAKDEFSRMKDNEAGWIKNEFPLIYDSPLTKIECRNLVVDSALPSPFHSSCYFCPFQSDKEWSDLTQKDLTGAIKIETEARKNDPRKDLYFHKTRKPLTEVNFNENKNEPNLFTCNEGSCFT